MSAPTLPAAPWLVLVLGIATARPDAAQGQDLTAVPVTNRIRISATAPALTGVHGRALSANSSGLTLEVARRGASPDTLRVPAAAITSLEVSLGRGKSAGRGAALGAAVLGTLGLVLALTDPGCPQNQFCFEATAGERAAFVAVSAAIGAGLGAIVGSAIPHERWTSWPGDPEESTAARRPGGEDARRAPW